MNILILQKNDVLNDIIVKYFKKHKIDSKVILIDKHINNDLEIIDYINTFDNIFITPNCAYSLKIELKTRWQNNLVLILEKESVFLRKKYDEKIFDEQDSILNNMRLLYLDKDYVEKVNTDQRLLTKIQNI